MVRTTSSVSGGTGPSATLMHACCYCACMAIIQIRDVPEGTYEIIRKRARHAGQSIQAYMKQHLVEFASTPTPAEVIADIEAELARRPPIGLTTEEILVARDDGRP